MSVRLASAPLTGRTGRGVTIAVVDSGIHGAHPHVQGITGGVGFDEFGHEVVGFADRLGHGTAVAAAIREKAPEAALIAVKVFDTTLATTGSALVAAIAWAVRAGAHVVNLSLGTDNPNHAAALESVAREAAASGVLIVSAAPQDGIVWLPGALPGVVGVEVDWALPRDACEVDDEGGALRIKASGFPRPIPGVPPERNFRGPSFAVANATGFIALAMEGADVRSARELGERLHTLSALYP